MFEIINMKADFEPWWMFEGWEETIRSRHAFDNGQEALRYCEELLAELRKKYPLEAMKKDCFYAFWTECEKDFCEACDKLKKDFHIVLTSLKKRK